MARYTETTGSWKLVVLQPRITRAFWSRRRAWQGEEVELHLETRYVPDGTAVSLEIREHGAAPDGDPIARISGDHRIQKGRCRATWTIALDPDSLGRDLALEGDRWELCFVARIDAPEVVGTSAPMYVDLQPLIVSV